jgi:hypothetical protein
LKYNREVPTKAFFFSCCSLKTRNFAGKRKRDARKS